MVKCWLQLHYILKGVLVLKGTSDITACQCLALLSTAWQCLALLSTSGLVSGGPGGPWPPQNFRIFFYLLPFCLLPWLAHMPQNRPPGPHRGGWPTDPKIFLESLGGPNR